MPTNRVPPKPPEGKKPPGPAYTTTQFVGKACQPHQEPSGKGTARIMLDTGATSNHYCKDSLAKFTRRCQGVRICTAGKELVVLDQIWTHPVFGEGMYNPYLACDLIRWSSVLRLFQPTVDYPSGTISLLALPNSSQGDWTATFEKESLWLRPVPTTHALQAEPAMVAVTPRKRDVNVWRFHQVMAHAPTEALVSMAQLPQNKNWGLTPARIRAQRLEDCPYCILGKTTARMPKGSTSATTGNLKPELGTVIHMDLASFTLGNQQRFALVAKEAATGFLSAKLLKRKTKEEVLVAVLEIKGLLQSLGFKLQRIHCDSEAVFKSLAHDLLKSGVSMVFVAPGVHERVSERAIRTLKTWLRANLAALSYNLPAFLFPFLLAHVARILNDTPNSRSGTTSPRRVLQPSFKLSRKLTTTVAFGDKALAHQIPTNNMSMPMRPVIYLGHATSEGNGGFRCFDLDTRRIIVANKIKPMDHDQDPAQEVKRLFGSIPPIGLNKGQFEEPPPLVAPTASVTPMWMTPNMPTGSPAHTAPLSPPMPIPLSPLLPPLPSDDEGDFPQAEEMAETYELPEPPADNEGDFPQSNNTVVATTTPSHTASAPLPKPPDGFSNRGRKIRPREEARRIQQGTAKRSKALIKATQRKGPGHPLPTEHSLVASTMRRDQIDRDMRTASQRREVAKFIENDVFTAVGKVVGEILPTHAFGKTIRNSLGVAVDYKTRLVVGGDKQKFGIPEDVGANTPGIELVLLLFQLCAARGLSAKTMDVTSAFHHSAAPRPIYARLEPNMAQIFCELDPTFAEHLRKDGKVNVRLNKAAYGLKEGPLEFQKYTTSKLAKQGFEPCESARCLYIKHLPGGDIHYLLCFVDDFLSVAPPDAHDVSFMAACYKAYTVNEGPVLEYLGLRAEFGKRHVFVSQPGYAETIIQEADVNNLSPSPLPYQHNLFELAPESPTLPPREAKRYVKVTMMLNFLAIRTRPDIKLATAFLTTRLTNPTKADWTKLIKTVRYLNGTKNLGLTFHAAGTTLSCQADASHGLHHDGRGQLGVCLWLGSSISAPIMTLCKRADAAATSSTHAEALALYRAAIDLAPTIWLLEQMGLKQQDPVLIGQDNQSLTQIVRRGPGWGGKSRHFELKFWWIKDLEDSGMIKLHYVKSEEQVPDGFTKPLDGKRFAHWREAVLGKAHREYNSYKNALIGKSSTLPRQ